MPCPIRKHFSWASLALVATLAGAFVPAGARARTIEVATDRVRMGELMPELAEPWASLDMGPAPEPLQEARFSKDLIEARLGRARMPLPPGILVPRVVRVVRLGQIVSEARLTHLARQSLISHLPPGTRLGHLRLSGGAALPAGAICLEPELEGELRGGVQPVRLAVWAGADRRTQSPVLIEASVDIELQTRRSRVPVLSRGSEVTLQVRTSGVLVQGSASAQEAGSVGDIIKVLPHQGSRMVQGRIIDARTVEVRL